MTLFNRRYTLSVGQAQTTDEDDRPRVARGVSALQIQFEVNKDAAPSPDGAKIKLYNPPEDIVSESQEKDAAVRLEAGYRYNAVSDNVGIVFQGLIRRTSVENNGVDRILTIECGDSDGIFRQARIAQAFPPGTSYQQIAEQLANKLGNFIDGGVSIEGAKKLFKEFITPAKHKRGKQQTTKGVSYTGSAYENFTKFLRQYGVRCVVQDNGIVRIAERDRASAQFPSAVVLSPETGLIGVPQTGENGVLKCRSLLQPGIKPFRQILVSGPGLESGSYVVDKVQHRGDFYAQEWYSDVEAIRIS